MEDVAWLTCGLDRLLACTFVLIVLLEAAPVAAQDGEPRWRVLPIRSEAEYRESRIGGEAEQHPQGIVRSPSHPDVIYLSHDVGQVWRSTDNGRTWDRALCKGMYVRCGQSIAVDPVDPNTVLAVMDSAWDYLSQDFEGVCRSTNGGESWQLVLQTEGQHQRTHQENLAYAPSSVTGGGAQRWYVAFPANALFRSDDAGRSWQRVQDLSDHELVFAVKVHPGDGNRVLLASSEGLFLSNDAGRTLGRLGDLPAGEVRSIRVNPRDPSDIYATVRGGGLFRSRDGGVHFQQVHSFDAMYVFVHPTQRELIYLVGESRARMLVSRDGGVSWQRPQMRPAQGLNRDTGSWKFAFDGTFSAVLPDPRDPASAVGYSHATVWRTEDGGRTFQDSSTLWTGYAWGWFTRPVAFDRFNPDRFAFFLYDVGMTITDNGGAFFRRRSTPWEWIRDGKIHHSGMYAGDIAPVPGSQVIVCSVGMYSNARLLRTENAGDAWTIVDDQVAEYLYVAFHDKDPRIVFAGRKRSTDGGRSFQTIRALAEQDAYIVGTTPSRPDTVYAITRDRRVVLRSDDRGETWRLYAKTDWNLGALDSKPTFLVDPSNADRFYSIDRRGDLALFDGKGWRSLGVLELAGGREQRNFVRRVAVDPRYPQIIYAATHAPGRPFVFRSTDAGRTWTDITRNQPRMGAGGLMVHPHTGDVFTGGCVGTRVLAPPYESKGSIYSRLPDDWRDRAHP